MAYLIVLCDRAVVDRRELTRPLTVGRSHECDVVVTDAKASRRHCAIEPAADGGWRVRDLGSRNGTHKAGQAVGECSLANGDVVWLGESVCLQFAEGEMPRRRPRHPHEALELARGAASEEKCSPELPAGPRPMPRAWESEGPESSPGDASAVSTDLNFGDEVRRGTADAELRG